MNEVTIDIQHLAKALGIDEKVKQVAEDVILRGVKPQGKNQPRIVRDRWNTFERFADAACLPYEDALKALDGELDETYISPQQVSQHRLNALKKTNDKLLKELEHAQAYVQNVVEILINDVGRVQPTPFKPSYNLVDGDHEEWAMLDVSDWHTASTWSHAETGFGDLSTPIMENRIELLTTKTLKLVNLQRRISPIRNICINWEGDFGENAYLHPGSAIHVDGSNMKTLKTNVNMAERMLKTFLGPNGFEEIHCKMVRGNHGRMGKKGEQHQHESWDDLFYYFLAERFIDEPRIKFHISQMPFMAYLLPDQPNWVHCIAHGDSIPSYKSIPLYGIDRAESSIARVLDRAINYSHFGHWHNAAQMDRTWGAVILNGSASGTSPYGIGLRLAGLPKQILMGMHPELGQTWVYHIYLDKRRPAVPDENGIITQYAEGL